MDINTIQIDYPYPGVHIYRNAVPKELNIATRLEEVLTKNDDPWLTWSPALVGDYQSIPDYRDCVDFKVRKKDFEHRPQDVDLKSIYDDIDVRLQSCLAHYTAKYNLSISYQEAVNFVRYGEGQHFATHSDSGFSYVCAVSTVIYFNNDYEGGELYFPHIDLKYTPSEGDVVLFPSNWLFSHAALPVKSGIKYSGVTMFDYTDRFHSDEFNRIMQVKSEKERNKA
jgi:2OG-Fe(II) oxygenase superfamily